MAKAGKILRGVPDAELIAEFRDRPGVWITVAGSAFLQVYAEQLRPLDLKPGWVMALAIIAEQPGITQSGLARGLRINRASSMALATLLENAQYVTRAAAAGRQRTTLVLSDLGRKRLIAACAVEDRLVEATIGTLSGNQRSEFVDLLKSITRTLNEVSTA